MIKSIYKVSLLLAMLGPLWASAQTSFTDDFNAGVTGWGGGSYTLTADNGAAKVIGYKTFQWDAFSKSFGPIDISSSPYVSIKIKSKIDFNITVGLGFGDMSQGNVKYPEKPVASSALAGNNPSSEIVASDDFQEVTFNFSGLTGTGVDLTKVTWINILINPLAAFDNRSAGREFYIDDVKIGTAAKLTPSLSNVSNQAFTVKATGSVAKLVKLRNITNGSDATTPVSISATS
ncbi:MAG TPA: hypothetical protein VF691_11595, partial [Cytophagaceae bacterium]